MQAAIRVKATVQAGEGRVCEPLLPVGEAVEVIVLLPESQTLVRRSAADIIAEAPGHRVFNSARK